MVWHAQRVAQVLANVAVDSQHGNVQPLESGSVWGWPRGSEQSLRNGGGKLPVGIKGGRCSVGS